MADFLPDMSDYCLLLQKYFKKSKKNVKAEKFVKIHFEFIDVVNWSFFPYHAANVARLTSQTSFL